MQQLKDVMSRDVKMVAPETTIREAAQQMRDGDFGMLPVAENDRMIGAISDRDIAVRAVADDKGPETPVRDVMSRGICWAYEDDSVDVAARLMSERQVRRLPVSIATSDSWASCRSAISPSSPRTGSRPRRRCPAYRTTEAAPARAARRALPGISRDRRATPASHPGWRAPNGVL